MPRVAYGEVILLIYVIIVECQQLIKVVGLLV